jgi:hypothetical protein
MSAVLTLLRVTPHLCSDVKNKKVGVEEREQVYLMQLWLRLNPYSQLAIESRYLAAFLKLVYQPYMQFTQQRINELITEAEEFFETVEKLQAELIAEPYLKPDPYQCSVGELVKETIDLSCRFSDYIAGVVKSSTKAVQDAQDEYSFRPKINEVSAMIDMKSNAGKIMRKSTDGSFQLAKTAHNQVARVERMI